MNSSDTFRLFKKRPSFLDGFASMLDHAPLSTRYRTSKNGIEADNAAIASDWAAVGADMQQAIDDYEAEYSASQSRQ